RKTSLGEKGDKLAPVEYLHPINDRKPPAVSGIFSVHFIDDQKDAARPQDAVHLPETLRGAGPEIYRFKGSRQIKCPILEREARNISLYDTAAAGLQFFLIDISGLFHGYFRIVQGGDSCGRVFSQKG